MDSFDAIMEGLASGGIGLVAHLPDERLDGLLTRIQQRPEFQVVGVAREEEGVGICAGSFLAGTAAALVMQNAGLLNSCNALVTTALQSEIPMLLVVWYAGDLGDGAFMRLGETTEPVLRALGIRSFVLRDPEHVCDTVAQAARLAATANRPVACLLTRDLFPAGR